MSNAEGVLSPPQKEEPEAPLDSSGERDFVTMGTVSGETRGSWSGQFYDGAFGLFG